MTLLRGKFLLSFLLGVLLLSGCAGGDPDAGTFTAPSIQDVYAATGAAPTQVIIVCRVSTMEGIKDYGILFGKQSLEKIPANNLKDNAFSVMVDNLEWSTDYRFQAYIDGGRGEILSQVHSWRTADETPPEAEILKITPALGKDAGRVSLQCMIRDFGSISGTDKLRCGVCFSPLQEEPTVGDASAAADGYSPVGAYSLELEGLLPATVYHFRCWTQIGEQLTYGPVRTVKIPSNEEVVVTGDFEGLSSNSVTLNGAVHLEEGTWTSRICGFEVDGAVSFADKVESDGAFSLVVRGLFPETEHSYRAFVKVDGTTFYGESRSFRTLAVPEGETEYVDLGLDVLWATCNLGASSPEEIGDLYAWGETEPKKEYTWSNYKWCMGTPESIFKYTKEGAQADNKMTLDPEDDAAHAVLGGKWRMPTTNDYLQLIRNTKYQVIKDGQGKISGLFLYSTVVGYTEKSIFIPGIGNCWTSQWDRHPYNAAIFHYQHGLDFLEVYDYPYYDPNERVQRCSGNPIRPVLER